MDRTEFLQATRQLAAAADILAKAGPEDSRFDASQMLAFFRQYDRLGPRVAAVASFDDELQAALRRWLDAMSLPRRTLFLYRPSLF